MATSEFVRGWTCQREGEIAATPVTLPHDAMISEPRSADAQTWAHGGYFPGGRYLYRKKWTPTAELAGKRVSLRFEGVYRHSTVLLDGHELGGSLNGYREFEVRLDPHLTIGTEQTVEVAVDNADTPNARWYTGSGIYRPVWLEVRDHVHIPTDGVDVRTRLIGDSAVVGVHVRLSNPDAVPAQIEAALSRSGRRIARGSLPLTDDGGVIELKLLRPALWSAEDPALHDLEITVTADGRELDRVERRIGLRVVELDPKRGLVVNGSPVKLRGANLHHDNGVVGAATFSGSERRRIRILKETGFTAVRSAHNPASRALLDACDELGMYVMDEAYDGWYDHKTTMDDAESFAESWSEDLASMVAKDRLRPSVIIYSIGNENGEALTPRGRRVASDLAARLRLLDPTRSVTIGVNLVGAAFAGIGRGYAKDAHPKGAKPAPDMTSTAINTVSSRFGFLMTRFPKLRAADRATRELFDLVDVAGYNYGTARYRIDAELHSDRLMVGTETMPGDIARNWSLVKRLPTLIGDFVWAGWDYLGEAGAGTWTYGTRSAPFMKPYPHLVSGMGMIDITGVPGASVRLAQAAWGTLKAPAITVRPLDVAAGPIAKTPWRSSDAIESWSWSGHDGQPADIEVYSSADQIELFLNDRSLGRKRVNEHLARFRCAYEPGVLSAVAHTDGSETSRSELRSAGTPTVRVFAEDESGSDVAYVRIELADDLGIVESAISDVVHVRVDGPARLVGLGSGAPSTEESFVDAQHSTYRGRALAVVRPDGAPGTITVAVSSRSHGSASLVLTPTGVLA